MDGTYVGLGGVIVLGAKECDRTQVKHRKDLGLDFSRVSGRKVNNWT